MERLRHRAQFLAAAAGFKAPSPAFVLQVRRREDDGPARVGFTVSRKVGSAVERNRVRRRLRAVVTRVALDQMRPGHDYVLVGRRAALTRSFGRLTEELGNALDRAHAQHAKPARADRGDAHGQRAARRGDKRMR